jgi:molybdopterin-guanine dinucleotide biosynthesis protein A
MKYRGQSNSDGPVQIGAILAGGRSSRFGSPKADARVLLQQHRAGLQSIIVVSDATPVVERPGVPVIHDLVPNIGPLGGLHAGLLLAREWGASGICLTPCDAPLIDVALYRSLLGASVGHQAVLPIDDGTGRVQPLFGWYSCETLPTIESQIRAGRYGVYQLVSSLVAIHLVHSNEIGLSASAFLNVNTVSDLESARSLLQRTEGR